jgi:hypothetical protein
MSTDLRNVPTTDIMQTRFFGDQGHIQLTREQAAILAAELMLFAEGEEVTEQLHQLLEGDDGAEALCEALCS